MDLWIVEAISQESVSKSFNRLRDDVMIQIFINVMVLVSSSRYFPHKDASVEALHQVKFYMFDVNLMGAARGQIHQIVKDHFASQSVEGPSFLPSPLPIRRSSLSKELQANPAKLVCHLETVRRLSKNFNPAKPIFVGMVRKVEVLVSRILSELCNVKASWRDTLDAIGATT